MSNAASIMTRDIITIRSSTAIKDYIKLIQERSFSGCPVIDAEGLAVGMVSHSDVLRGLAAFSSPGASESGVRKRVSIKLLAENVALDSSRLERFLSMTVSEIMSLGLYSCHPHTHLSEVCDMMTRHRLHKIVVIDASSKVVGIISATDLVRHLGNVLKKDPEEEPMRLKNIPPEDLSDKEESD